MRGRFALVVVTLAVMSAAAKSASTPAQMLDARGLGCVETEDTIKVGAVRSPEGCQGGKLIRLVKIAVPRMDEPGGPEALAMLKTLVEGQMIACILLQPDERARIPRLTEERDHDIYASSCSYGYGTPSGGRLEFKMIEIGLARDCPRFSEGAFRMQEGNTAWSRRGDLPIQRFELPERCKANR